MNPARLMAMTTARPVNMLSVGRATGVADINPSIAAGMCAGMPENCYQALRLKWADDWSQANVLEKKLWMAAVDLAIDEKWRVPKGKELLRKLAGMALYELVYPGKLREHQQRAAFIGMERMAYYKTWRCRYEQVYQILDGWAQEGYRHLQKQSISDSMNML